jgi:hypothetical protein
MSETVNVTGEAAIGTDVSALLLTLIASPARSGSTADDVHKVNLRVEKNVALPRNRTFSVSVDLFDLFNNAAASSFLSADIRSANFGIPSNFQAARVGQLAMRMTF